MWLPLTTAARGPPWSADSGGASGSWWTSMVAVLRHRRERREALRLGPGRRPALDRAEPNHRPVLIATMSSESARHLAHGRWYTCARRERLRYCRYRKSRLEHRITTDGPARR